MEQGGAATWAASALVSAAQTRQRCCCCWRTRAGAEGALPLLGLRSLQRRSRARRVALIGWRRTAASGATVGGGCASELRARRCYGVRLVPQLAAAALVPPAGIDLASDRRLSPVGVELDRGPWPVTHFHQFDLGVLSQQPGVTTRDVFDKWRHSSSHVSSWQRLQPALAKHPQKKGRLAGSDLRPAPRTLHACSER